MKMGEMSLAPDNKQLRMHWRSQNPPAKGSILTHSLPPTADMEVPNPGLTKSKTGPAGQGGSSIGWKAVRDEG